MALPDAPDSAVDFSALGASLTRRSLLALAAMPTRAADWDVAIQQLTRGPMHHFFGYIGHVQNIPWNGDGRYIVTLRTGFQDRMPKPADAAEVVLIDTRDGNREAVIDRTHAWNFQQGTMFYWNPAARDTQLFFNDRDLKTNRVFTVLYDIAKKKRMREFRFADTPAANSGVEQSGARFLALNYGRLARLRPVTGYPEAHDWTAAPVPDNDGVFLIDSASGAKKLLVSFRQLEAKIKPVNPTVAGRHLFINHTLWNRAGNRIYFYVRADYAAPREKRLDVPCTIRPDGTGLTVHDQFIGGHPEWEDGSRIIGSVDGKLILYDVDRKQIAGVLGDGSIFPDPGGDTALSPDGKWIVNGYRKGVENRYVVMRRSDSSNIHTRGFPHPGWTSGELRVDGSPCWNRTSDGFLFPAIAPDGTRQLFVARILTAR